MCLCLRVITERLVVLSLSLVLLMAGGGGHAKADATDAVVPLPLVTSLQVSSTKEFIELYNPTTTSMQTNGWKLVYSNVSGSNVKTVALLPQSIEPLSYVVYASSDFISEQSLLDPLLSGLVPTLYTGMADTGGSLTMYAPVPIDADYPDGYMLVDKIGWRNTTVGIDDEENIMLSGLQSAKRCTDASQMYVSRSSNQLDFYISATHQLFEDGDMCVDLAGDADESIEPTPAEDPPLVDDQDQPAESTPGSEEEPSQEAVVQIPALSCEGVIIHEIYPNSPGDDSGNEFIELYNSTPDVINLNGCSIEQGTAYYTFNSKVLLDPGDYILISDAISGITLPNSSGGTVRLVSAAQVEISSSQYPADMAEDVSWSYFEDDYSLTYSITPGRRNVHTPLKPCEAGYERSQETGRCNKIVLAAVESVAVCGTGYWLNEQTGRCNKLEEPTELAPCKPGQERNPETGRCRNIVSYSSTTLMPCPTGQYRNPETNRCKLLPITKILEPCPEGQERNPETNRCRKTVLASAGSQSTEVIDIPATPSSPAGSLMTISFVCAGALSYALYEWRQEFLKIINGVATAFGLLGRK